MNIIVLFINSTIFYIITISSLLPHSSLLPYSSSIFNIIVIHSFIHSEYLYSATTQRRSQVQHRYCVGVNMPKLYRQQWVKDSPKVPTWWLEWDSKVETAAYRTQGTEPTTEPPCPARWCYIAILTLCSARQSWIRWPSSPDGHSAMTFSFVSFIQLLKESICPCRESCVSCTDWHLCRSCSALASEDASFLSIPL